MKAASLYALTAVVTGLHNFYGLMGMVNGAPINLLNCSALLGSAILLAAAVLVPFNPQTAGYVGLSGSVLSWVFYVPLIVASFLMPFTMWLEMQNFFHFREFVPLIGMILGPVLLIACTVNSLLYLRPKS